MAPKKGFADFDPIFGEAKSELHREPEPEPASSSSRPVLFHAYAIDSSRLRIVATDFLSLSWDRVLTVSDLEDLVISQSNSFHLFLPFISMLRE